MQSHFVWEMATIIYGDSRFRGTGLYKMNIFGTPSASSVVGVNVATGPSQLSIRALDWSPSKSPTLDCYFLFPSSSYWPIHLLSERGIAKITQHGLTSVKEFSNQQAIISISKHSNEQQPMETAIYQSPIFSKHRKC